MSSAEKALAHFENNKATYLDDLKTLVRIPSVSFPGYPAETLVRSAEAVADLLRARGLENVELLTIGNAHPYVYGDWLHAPGKPTVLLYAHHDVQPIGRREVWKSDPFEPEERGGRLFGRGAADDKAGIVVHTGSIAAFLDAGEPLPVNVKVIIEGEEECGSSHLGEFLTRYKDKMMADVMVLTDAGNFDTGYPALTTSLRGLVAVDVEVVAQKAPLHSGMWGGPVVDPAVALSKMLGSLLTADGRIAIKEIYDQVRPLTKAERAELKKLPLSEKEFRKQTGMRVQSPLMGGKGEILEKLWRLPSLTVNAIQASNRQGAANIVCDRAWARVGIRTVPDMDGKTVRRLLVDHLKKAAPWGVEVQVKGDARGSWWTTDVEHPAFQAATRALEKGYAHRAAFIGCGGSIPFVGPFAKALGGVPALLVGVEDPYTLAHSENESLHLGDFDKAIRSSILLYQELASLPPKRSIR